MLQAGLAEIEITPPEYGTLGRLIADPTPVTGVICPLYARAVIIDDGAVRAAIVSIDMGFMFPSSVGEIREHIASAGGLETTNIMVCCTHTHNSFGLTPWHEEDSSDFAELDRLKGLLRELIADAGERMAPCRIRAGSAEATGWTRNRRSLYRGANGALHVGTHGPEDVESFVGVEGPVDDELKVLFFEGENGSALGGLVNFAAHPITMFGQPVYSSSYIGPLTEALKAKYGGVFGFLYGLGGNLCPSVAGDGEEINHTMGVALAEVAEKAISSATPLRGSGLGISREVIAMPLRRVTRGQIRAAKKYQKMDPAEVDMHELCHALYGHDFIFYGDMRGYAEIFVNEIIGTWEHHRRMAKRHPTADVEVQVIRVGNAAVAGFSSEQFCELKHEIQSVSPFPHTFFASVTNGGTGYMPTREAFANGGYETCIGVSSPYVEDALERVKESALRQLRALA